MPRLLLNQLLRMSLREDRKCPLQDLMGIPAGKLLFRSCLQIQRCRPRKLPPRLEVGCGLVLHGLGMLGISAFGGTFGQEGFRFSLSRDEWFSATRTWIPLTSEQNLLVPPLALTNRVR